MANKMIEGLNIPRIEVDPVTLQVLGGSFKMIAQEMGMVLYRMSYSSIIRESEDIGAGIVDITGRQLCESESTPMHVGSIGGNVKGICGTVSKIGKSSSMLKIRNNTNMLIKELY